MRKQIIQLSFGVVLALSAGMILSSCGAEDAVKPNCTTVDDYCGSGSDLETCCTTAKCYYKWNGNKYDCNGTDCQSAAFDVASDACGTSVEDIDALLRIPAALVKQAAN